MQSVVAEITLDRAVLGPGSPAHSPLMWCSYHWPTSGDEQSVWIVIKERRGGRPRTVSCTLSVVGLCYRKLGMGVGVGFHHIHTPQRQSILLISYLGILCCEVCCLRLPRNDFFLNDSFLN